MHPEIDLDAEYFDYSIVTSTHSSNSTPLVWGVSVSRLLGIIKSKWYLRYLSYIILALVVCHITVVGSIITENLINMAANDKVGGLYSMLDLRYFNYCTFYFESGCSTNQWMLFRGLRWLEYTLRKVILFPTNHETNNPIVSDNTAKIDILKIAFPTIFQLFSIIMSYCYWVLFLTPYLHAIYLDFFVIRHKLDLIWSQSNRNRSFWSTIDAVLIWLDNNTNRILKTFSVLRYRSTMFVYHFLLMFLFVSFDYINPIYVFFIYAYLSYEDYNQRLDFKNLFFWRKIFDRNCSLIRAFVLCSGSQHNLDHPEELHRKNFDDLYIKIKDRPDNNNLHYQLANDRRAVNNAMNNYITLSGGDRYHYGINRLTQFKDSGRVIEHDVMDYTRDCNDRFTRDHILTCLDTDHHLTKKDFNKYLKYGRPVMIYTYDPTKLYEQNELYRYSFDEENNFCFFTDGARPYRHQLWDYNHDIISITSDRFITFCRVRIKTLRNHRRVVCLIPLYTVRRCLLINVFWYFIGNKFASELDYVKYYNPSVGISYKFTLEEVQLSLPNMTTQVSLPLNTYAILLTLWNNPTTFMASAQNYVTPSQANLLKSIFSKMRRHPIIDSSLQHGIPFNTEPTLQSGFYDRSPQYTEPVNAGTFILKRMITDNVFAPSRSLQNDARCVQERLLNVSPKDNFPMHYLNYLDEFASNLFPYKLHPVEIDEFLQALPGNKYKAYAQIFSEQPPNIKKRMQSFQKVECYNKTAAPRNISAVDPVHVAKYSLYMRAITNAIKHRHFYAFSDEPKNVALKLHNLMVQEGVCVESDFSKFDGSQGLFCKLFETTILKRCFTGTDRIRVIKLHRKIVLTEFRTMYKIKYNSNGSRLSGSADTSIMNTLLNLYLNYLTYRLLGYSIDESFRRLGLYGGDDGVSVYTDSGKKFEEVCTNIGIGVKMIVRKDKLNVSFLGRIYPCPAESPQSYADPSRVFSKLGFSDSNEARHNPDLALWRKLISLYITDSDHFFWAPFAKHWLSKLKTRRGKFESEVFSNPNKAHLRVLGEMSNKSVFRKYPVENTIYPENIYDYKEQFIGYICNLYQISIEEFGDWSDRFFNEEWDPFYPPTLIQPIINYDPGVVIHDQQMGPSNVVIPADYLNTPAEDTVRPLNTIPPEKETLNTEEQTNIEEFPIYDFQFVPRSFGPCSLPFINVFVPEMFPIDIDQNKTSQTLYKIKDFSYKYMNVPEAKLEADRYYSTDPLIRYLVNGVKIMTKDLPENLWRTKELVSRHQSMQHERPEIPTTNSTQIPPSLKIQTIKSNLDCPPDVEPKESPFPKTLNYNSEDYSDPEQREKFRTETEVKRPSKIFSGAPVLSSEAICIQNLWQNCRYKKCKRQHFKQEEICPYAVCECLRQHISFTRDDTRLQFIMDYRKLQRPIYINCDTLCKQCNSDSPLKSCPDRNGLHFSPSYICNNYLEGKCHNRKCHRIHVNSGNRFDNLKIKETIESTNSPTQTKNEPSIDKATTDPIQTTSTTDLKHERVLVAKTGKTNKMGPFKDVTIKPSPPEQAISIKTETVKTEAAATAAQKQKRRRGKRNVKVEKVTFEKEKSETKTKPIRGKFVYKPKVVTKNKPSAPSQSHAADGKGDKNSNLGH